VVLEAPGARFTGHTYFDRGQTRNIRKSDSRSLQRAVIDAHSVVRPRARRDSGNVEVVGPDLAEFDHILDCSDGRADVPAVRGG
jgi:hypothetical protein